MDNLYVTLKTPHRLPPCNDWRSFLFVGDETFSERRLIELGTFGGNKK